ncbi:MAG: drug resistance transporter, EmrB/QacA family [Firmicutes bacterium]|nr:drug resistance transporter, EmrB/QacA family [Bacillota bacterium]
MMVSATHTASKLKVWQIKIALILAGFFGLLNETSLNVALNVFMTEFHVSVDTVQWLTTGFLLIIGILVPVMACLIQRFSTRKLYLSSMSLFIIGTIIAGCSSSFIVLLTGRLIQAVGTGIMMPLTFNTILVITPPEKRGSALGAIGLVILFAPAIGPTLSGLVLELLNWRWLFFGVLPFSILTLIYGYVYLVNVTDLTTPKLDILSIILSTLGFGGIIYGFSVAVDLGLTNLKVLMPLIIGFIGTGLFVQRQLTLKEPMLDLSPFKYPMFTAGIILIIVSMMTVFSTMLLLPIFLQSVLALSAFASGLIMLPGGALTGIMSPVIGRLFDKLGPRVLVAPALIIMAVMVWFMAHISASTTIVTIIFLHCCILVGVSMVMTSAQTNGLNQLPPRYYPHGSAIMNTIQQLAGAMGTSLFIGIMSATEHSYLKNSVIVDSAQQVTAIISGVNNAFSIGVLIIGIGLIVSLFLKRSSNMTLTEH